MFEAPQILAILSLSLLIAATAAWVKLATGPRLQHIDGTTDVNAPQLKLASRLLVLGLGVSAGAAALALFRLMFG